MFLQVQRGRIGTAALGDLDSGKLVTKRSRACSIIGTPSFMAPEVLSSENRTEYTEKVDGTLSVSVMLPRATLPSHMPSIISVFLWNAIF